MNSYPYVVELVNGYPTSNGDGTQTWKYRVSLSNIHTGMPKDINNFSVELCGNPKQAVVFATPSTDYIVNTPKQGQGHCLFGFADYQIKWNKPLKPVELPVEFSFTLSKQYKPTISNVAIRSGNECFYYQLKGPSGTEDKNLEVKSSSNNNPTVSISSCEGTCKDTVEFTNLISVPVIFNTGDNWRDVSVSVKKDCLECIIEPCEHEVEGVTFNDPCGNPHTVDSLKVTLKKIRVVGAIQYIISVQEASTDDPSFPPASVSGYFTKCVDQVIEFSHEGTIENCSLDVFVEGAKLDGQFEYGEDIALKINGIFRIRVTLV